MIVGRFGDTTGRPHIEGRLSIPSFKKSTDISFIMDTGADRTVLMPMDAAKMGLDCSALTDRCQNNGVGGISLDYVVDAIATFSDPGVGLHTYKISLIVSFPTPHNQVIQSLLGRDILDRWRILYEPANKRLHADVLFADNTITLGQGARKR